MTDTEGQPASGEKPRVEVDDVLENLTEALLCLHGERGVPVRSFDDYMKEWAA